jgi:Flp pilus assembly protein TadG
MRIGTPLRRRGATVVEAAVIYSLWFVLLFAILQGGIMILNYQEVAWLGREASRRASVQGSQYATETGNASPTQSQLLQNVVLPSAVALDPTKLTVAVFLVDGNTGAVTSWDSSTKAIGHTLSDGSTVANRVRVTVTYTGASAILLGTLTLQSTTEVPMLY